MNPEDIARLSVSERLQLIEQLWDSLPPGLVTSEEIPESHLAELVHRRSDAAARPGVGKPWREILNALEARP